MIQVKCLTLKGKQMKPLTGRDNYNNTVLKIMTKKLNDFATKLLRLCIRYLKNDRNLFKLENREIKKENLKTQ